MSDERLQCKGSLDTNREIWVGHTFQNVAIDNNEIVGIFEIKLLELFHSVASSRAKESLGAPEIGEDKSNQKILDLLGNGALLPQDDAGKGSNHAQSTFLGNVILLALFRSFVLADNRVDERQNCKCMRLSGFGEGNQEVGCSNIRRGNLFVKIKLVVKIFLRIRLELLDILRGEAHDRKQEMSDERIKMWLEMIPHLFGSDTLIKENEGV